MKIRKTKKFTQRQEGIRNERSVTYQNKTESRTKQYEKKQKHGLKIDEI